jgi:hypothetical protein
MTHKIGSNQNTNAVSTVTTITLNNLTATTISAENLDRLALDVCLGAGTANVNIFIRPYAAAVDDLKNGHVLTRYTMGNVSYFMPAWSMRADNIYTGEYSAITDIGTVDVHVMEY